jgi:hypothetical protein
MSYCCRESLTHSRLDSVVHSSAARMLGVSPETLDLMVDQGTIDQHIRVVYRVGAPPMRVRRYLRKDIARIIKSRPMEVAL